MRRSFHRPSDPTYYIEDCRILRSILLPTFYRVAVCVDIINHLMLVELSIVLLVYLPKVLTIVEFIDYFNTEFALLWAPWLETFLDFLCKLGMKPNMRLLEITIFSQRMSSSDTPKVRTTYCMYFFNYAQPASNVGGLVIH